MKKNIFVGIDLGGTNTKIGLFDSQLKLLKNFSLRTDVNSGPEANAQNWVASILEYKDQNLIQGVGIGSPGPLDSKKGCILDTPNLKNWEGFSFKKFFEKKLKASVVFENDANCAAVGEWHKSKTSHLVVLTLGTGVGSGVISENILIRGSRGLAVEAGHITIDSQGDICACGKIGCLETFVGGAAFVKKYQDLTQNKNSITPKEIFARAPSDDSVAQKLVENWSKALAIGVGSLINLFNPEKVILTGGLSHAFGQVEKHFHNILLTQAFKESLKYVEVRVSKIQDKAGILGAATLAAKRL